MNVDYSMLEPFWKLKCLNDMRGQMQNEWHRYDVRKHTKKVYTITLERNPDSVKLHVASILHDIGKPETVCFVCQQYFRKAEGYI